MRKTIVVALCAVILCFSEISRAGSKGNTNNEHNQYASYETLLNSVPGNTDADSLNAETILSKLGIKPVKNDLIHAKLHWKSSLNTYFDNQQSGLYNTAFIIDHIRLQIFGQINSWLSYDIRQRLNGSSETYAYDNSSFALDWGYVNIQFGNFSAMVGKQWGVFGGWEMEANPIDVHIYSDFLNMSDAFLTGAAIQYTYKNQQFFLQALDSHSGSFTDWYGFKPDSIQEAKATLTYLGAWFGSLFNNHINTRWSVTASNEARGYWVYGFSPGTKYLSKRVVSYFDYYFTYEQIDSRQYITNILNSNLAEDSDQKVIAQNAIYHTMLLRTDVNITSRLVLLSKYVYEYGLHKDHSSDVNRRYYQSHKLMGGAEYHLTKDGLRLFTYYAGSFRDYDKTIEKKYGLKDNYTSNFSIGFVYHMNMY